MEGSISRVPALGQGRRQELTEGPSHFLLKEEAWVEQARKRKLRGGKPLLPLTPEPEARPRDRAGSQISPWTGDQWPSVCTGKEQESGLVLGSPAGLAPHCAPGELPAEAHGH